MNKTPTVLIIMDGFGLTDSASGNAVKFAKTPVLDRLFAEYPHTPLSASGLDVGLPDGQMGNSEVGHTNIGGGRVVFQDLPRISKSITDGDFFTNPAYNHAMDACKEKGSSLHLMGLLSDGGVHSHNEHLYGLIQMAKDNGISSLANMIIVGSLLEHHPELSLEGVEAVVNKLVPPKKAALIELNMKALQLGSEYSA